MVIRKQLEAIRKIAMKNMEKNPEHFGALVSEIDAKLEEMKADHIAYIETLEFTEDDDFSLRDIA